jgi:hypothetical protein
MIGPLCFVLAFLASPFMSKMRLEADNARLQHQLIVLRRIERKGSGRDASDIAFLTSNKECQVVRQTQSRF